MLDRAQIAREYLRGATGTEIAARYGVTVATIYYHLRLAGVRCRPKNHSRMRSVSIPELSRLLQSKDLTIDQLAAHFGVSVPTIVRRMRKHGLASCRGHGSPGPANFFWQGGQRTDKEGYLMVKAPDHPQATRDGYVRQHRLVVERELGRFLLPAEIVHHRDGDPTNNDPDNLEVFATQADHMRHEWATNWYPRIDELRASFRNRRARPKETPSLPASETDGGA